MIDSSAHTASIPQIPADRGDSPRLSWRHPGHWLAWAELAWQVSCERRALAGLSAQQLRDVGVSAGDAAHEMARPWWQIPANRLRR